MIRSEHDANVRLAAHTAQSSWTLPSRLVRKRTKRTLLGQLLGALRRK